MQRADVLILGGGLVGLTTALALDAHGLTSVVIDPADPAKMLTANFDGRASAIASASWRMLEAIGVASRLDTQGCKIRRIEVRDGLSKNPLDFTPTDGEALGIMVENRLVRRALYEAALAAEHVTLKAPARATSVTRGPSGVHAVLDDGSTIDADLLIAAEGRNSPTRAAAGIRTASWKYDHTAIISAFDHSIPHDNVAHEIFYPAGPFALLPMLPGNRSALVWTVTAKDAPGILALSDHAFAVEAHKRTGGLLGELSAAAPRSSYPLSFHHAAVITGERLALVGDAAHGIHPIAGQGLNLGFRDVAALVEVLVEGSRLGLDLADVQLLARYQSWRSFDTLMVATATDTLTRLFGIPGRPARAVRRFGLGAVRRIAPLKSMFMAEARGETGALPKLLQGITI
ncbi:FAD-dependent oxidoreductase [Sphingomonas paeninsulae]|uniref:FAD-dependent oxidoreductase n=1 Tax=Sphingomonas paeninsulae TaxID=2319844 RepID=A0A494TB40_SPHPE|nr:FAD-dependent monooxygenase [Sphingomonas paeninsulae]AYJ86597.1 FAD-dependent oxidoreductase [Sphingomonas paeninsulae]